MRVRFERTDHTVERLASGVDIFPAIVSTLNPTAWWRFDDLANPPSDNSYDAAVLGRADTVALWDSDGSNLVSGGAHAGTVNGNPVVVEGPLLGAANGGGALDYDGVDDALLMAYSAALNPSPAFSVSAWIFVDAIGATQTIVANRNAAGLKGWDLRITGGGTVQLGMSDGAATSFVSGTASAITAGRWFHVAASYDGVDVRIVVDGVLQVTGADTYVANDNHTLRIGTAYNGSAWFNGKIAKPALHNAALTASEFAALFVKGRPVLDAMGSHPGGMIGNPTSATGAVSGDTNACFDFGGSTARVVVPYAAALNAATFSVSGWVKRDADTGADEFILDSRSAINTGYSFYIGSADKPILRIGAGASGTQTIATTSLAVDTWYHVAATYDGTNGRIYVNGALETTSVAVTMSANTTGPTTIGSSFAGTSLMNGKIDELTYHGGVVLTDAQIAAVYRANRVPSVGFSVSQLARAVSLPVMPGRM